MLGYCDPPSGIAEWREPRPSWSDAHSAEDLRASRALGAALAEVRATLSSRESNPAGKTLESLEEEFATLVTVWREATENISSFTKIVSHPSYQTIIERGKRGEPVVPLILRDLRDTGGFWALALSAITGENPVPSKHIGNPAKVKEDWIAWGRQHGYL
jgi:hypothetical protein